MPKIHLVLEVPSYVSTQTAALAFARAKAHDATPYSIEYDDGRVVAIPGPVTGDPISFNIVRDSIGNWKWVLSSRHGVAEVGATDVETVLDELVNFLVNHNAGEYHFVEGRQIL